MDQILFTPSAVLGLLSEIDELNEFDINAEESEDGMRVTIGESTYNIVADNAVEIEIDDEAAQDVEEANEIGYEELEDSNFEVEDEAPVEGGLVKELLKTLALGGLVRMTKNALQNS